ncbi:MAG: ATP-binding cassette domain-containing protein, partial [Verrucomicrobiota bacterium]
MPEEPSSTAPVAQLEMAAICSNISTRSEVLENVNWSVAPGDYWVIGGLPGSGKSDLLSTLGGLSRLARGTLRLFGNEVRQMAEEELVQIRKRIGFVFAYGGRLFNHLTVAENLALPFCYHENCIPSGAEDRVHRTLAAL